MWEIAVAKHQEMQNREHKLQKVKLEINLICNYKQ